MALELLAPLVSIRLIALRPATPKRMVSAPPLADTPTPPDASSQHSANPIERGASYRHAPHQRPPQQQPRPRIIRSNKTVPPQVPAIRSGSRRRHRRSAGSRTATGNGNDVGTA